MRLIHIRHIILVILLSCYQLMVAQDNVGIGTAAPHPSALLEISDSSRGVLIPRTDTLSVLQHVNSLTPNPGIEGGLLIFDVKLNTYMYYDKLNDKWRKLIDMVGPTGKQGFRGPQGPQGPRGTSTDWRDSNLAVPNFDPVRDTCGDWYINRETGKVWRYWCDSAGTKNQWRDTNYFDFYIGELMAPDERIEVYNLQGSTDLTETMANSTDVVVMKPIPGLSQSIALQNDEIAYVLFAAHGTATRAFPGGDIGYAAYDINVIDGIPTWYFAGLRNYQPMISLGPSGPPPPLQPLQALSDRPGWYIGGSYEYTAPISARPECRCGHPWAQDPNCNCPNGGFVSFSVYAGNWYSGSATTNIIVLSDAPQKEAVGHLNLFVVIRRNPETRNWKR